MLILLLASQSQLYANTGFHFVCDFLETVKMWSHTVCAACAILSLQESLWAVIEQCLHHLKTTQSTFLLNRMYEEYV
jgi:hypothetical protein